MKKLVFISLMLFAFNSYASLIVTRFSVEAGGSTLTWYYYPGDTLHTTFTLYNCPSANDSVTFEIYKNDANNTVLTTIKKRVKDLDYYSWDTICKNNIYKFDWVVPNTPGQNLFIGIQNDRVASYLFYIQPSIITDYSLDIITQKTAYRFYTMQGVELPNEPKSGLYIQESIMNGNVTRKKIYKTDSL